MPKCRVLVEVYPGHEKDFEEKGRDFFVRARDRLGFYVGGAHWQFVLGPYDYVVEFECREPDDVSLIVLELREALQDEIASTLTLLEGGVRIGPEIQMADLVYRCFMLVVAKPGAGGDVVQKLRGETEIRVTEVFGPFDFIIEFVEDNVEHAIRRIRTIRGNLRSSIERTVTLAGMRQANP